MKPSNPNWLLRVISVALLVCCLSAAGLPLYAQGRYEGVRGLVSRTQEDLRRAADFTSVKKDERERIGNVQKHLSDFDRYLSKNKFNKDKLNDAIDDLKNVVEHNTLAVEDRDALARDLQDLRAMRARHD